MALNQLRAKSCGIRTYVRPLIHVRELMILSTGLWKSRLGVTQRA